jgi:hypothetical protein
MGKRNPVSSTAQLQLRYCDATMDQDTIAGRYIAHQADIYFGRHLTQAHQRQAGVSVDR